MIIRPLEERDLADAERIFRLAFGTWLKLPDPMLFAGDASWIRSRWRGRLGGAHAAEIDGRFAGSNLTTNHGSVAFFGPLTVDPEHWGSGIAQALVAAAIGDFTRWGVRYGGLYTFADSPLHIALYRKFGFWPGYLTGILTKPLTAGTDAGESTGYEAAGTAGRAELERAADAICGTVCDGLTVASELRSVAAQALGDAVFVGGHPMYEGFAVCHCGAGSEAGSGTCRVKFAAATGAAAFGRLADAWEAFGRSRGAAQIELGANYGRELATRALLQRGYRAVRHGVVMYRPSGPAYDRVDSWVVEDWR